MGEARVPLQRDSCLRIIPFYATLGLMKHAKDRLDPIAERLREDLRKYLSRKPHVELPPGAGAFDSRHTDTAERAEEVLIETGFGQDRE